MSERVSKVLYMILSLLIAILFWLYVDNQQGNRVTESYYNIPVEFIGETDSLVNKGLMLTGGQDTSVSLRLSGPRMLMSNLHREDIRIQVDLSNINATGQYTRGISIYYPANVDRSKIAVEYQSVYSVTVFISALTTKTVEVDVDVIGEVPEPYIFRSEQLVVEPYEITISGREEDVEKVEKASIVVDLSGATKTMEKEYSYVLLDSADNAVQNGDIRVSEKKVTVTAPIYMTKELDLSVKWKESPGSMLENVRWEIKPANSITVVGDEASLEGKRDIVLGEIDLSAWMNDTERTFDIRIPANCENISGITTATISIEFVDLAIKPFTVSNITLRGLSEGQQAEIITASLNVMLRGSAEDLELITEEDIRIVVDLSDRNDNGTYTVPATIYVDGYDQVGAVGSPYVVAVELTS